MFIAIRNMSPGMEVEVSKIYKTRLEAIFAMKEMSLTDKAMCQGHDYYFSDTSGYAIFEYTYKSKNYPAIDCEADYEIKEVELEE